MYFWEAGFCSRVVLGVPGMLWFCLVRRGYAISAKQFCILQPHLFGSCIRTSFCWHSVYMRCHLYCLFSFFVSVNASCIHLTRIIFAISKKKKNNGDGRLSFLFVRSFCFCVKCDKVILFILFSWGTSCFLLFFVDKIVFLN